MSRARNTCTFRVDLYTNAISSLLCVSRDRDEQKGWGSRARKYYCMYLAMKNKLTIIIVKNICRDDNAKKYRNKMQYMQAKPAMMA